MSGLYTTDITWTRQEPAFHQGRVSKLWYVPFVLLNNHKSHFRWLNIDLTRHLTSSSLDMQMVFCVNSVFRQKQPHVSGSRLLLARNACLKDPLNPVSFWRETYVASVLACWWGLLRCCQRHCDNGSSIQNDFRRPDCPGGICEAGTEPHRSA